MAETEGSCPLSGSDAASSSTESSVSEAESGCFINVQSSDGATLKIPLRIAHMWKTVHTMLQDLGSTEPDEVIPIQKCSEQTLKLVVEWCRHYEATPGPFPPIDDQFADLNFDDSDIDDDDDPQMKEIKFMQEMKIPDWDAEFLSFKGADNAVELLLDVTEAANYLDIEDLLKICCKLIANTMAGSSPEQIRQIFGITCDYTAQELAELKDDLSWCEGMSSVAS